MRNIIVRGACRPLRVPAARPTGPREQLAQAVSQGALGTDELLDRYATLVYHDAGGYVAASERLGLDRRTVKRRVNPELLEELRRG